MKRVLKILGIVLGVVVLVILIFAAKINFSPIASYDVELKEVTVTSDSATLVRGKQIVLTLCYNCHSNKETGRMSGGHLSSVEIFGNIYAPNITSHAEMGKLAKYSDAELVRLIRTGVKRDGQYAPPYMVKLPLLSDNDLNALLAFLRSDDPLVAPDPAQQPESKPSFFTKFLCTVAIKPLPYPEGPITDPDPNNAVELGEYVATGLAGCFQCHSADFAKNSDLEPATSEGFFGGGNKMLDREVNEVLSRNITMDEETGIGSWTEDQFVKAVMFGSTPDGRVLKYPMEPYNHLSEKEIRAVWSYLQTVPKISNKVPLRSQS